MKATFSLILSPVVVCVMLFFGCSSKGNGNIQEDLDARTKDTLNLEGLSTTYFSSGCFWCVEAIFESVRGVEEAISGYAGGTEQNPTYQQVSAGETGHAETVKVSYNPDIVSFATLVKVYYGSQDPTTVNGQHPDYGRQYRSIIFYQNEEERQIAEDYKDSLGASGIYNKPIATEIAPFKKFWMAEEYHQDYEERNPNQPYVRSVSIPRLKKFQAKFPGLLKEGTGHSAE